MADMLVDAGPRVGGPAVLSLPVAVVKQDGRLVAFDPGRIEVALGQCFASLGRVPGTELAALTRQAVNIISARPGTPSVEQVQDVVEMVLQAAGEYEAAKHYILYRAEHAQARLSRLIPTEVRQAFDQSARFFPTPLQQFQFYGNYSGLLGTRRAINRAR